MTSEVAIVNKGAVAVAADSAITVGKAKVHRSGNKIFAICDGDPIGAMIYGHAELSGVPWETLLKLFRAERGKTAFDTVEDCFGALRKFLAEDRFRTDMGSDESLARFAISIIEMVKDRVDPLPSKNKRQSVDEAINLQLAFYDHFNETIDFDCPSLGVFRREATDLVVTIADAVFDEIAYKVPKALRPKFVQLVHRALSSSYATDYKSGLVLFGFGREEIAPQVVAHEFDCTPFGRLRTIPYDRTDATKSPATIIPFARRHVMDSVIQGVSGQLVTFFLKLIELVAEEVANRVITDNFSLSPEELIVSEAIAKKVAREIAERFQTQCEQYIHATYVDKLIEIVENMPKEELATLAQALVEVTALRVRVSEAIETVGGPVDVCVVSKGDGLIWIKRKNYFDLMRNIQYLYRRFGDIGPIPLGGTDEG